MSTRTVEAEVLGTTVTGVLVARESSADYGGGPRDTFVVDVDGSRYRVPEDDVQPR